MKGSYKRYLSGSGSLLLLMLALIVLSACAANGMSGTPQINITEPKEGSEVAAGSVSISVEVMNFNLADNLGKANVAGEGHIHWFMDAITPTAPGKNAKAKQGRNAPSSSALVKSYTWTNVAAGMHNFSVELVNNDHTPLSPPAVAEVNVAAKEETLKMVKMPQINITEPKEGSEVAAGNVTVSVEVMNFSLVDSFGKANVAGEGHIHWFMDAITPTAPGKNARAKQGRNAPSSSALDKSYTWTNVAAGMHNFSVELVNNDHTPLSPPAVAEVNVAAKEETLKTMSVENVTVGLIAKSMAFNTSIVTVPAGARVTVNFDNQDANVPHNFAVYDSASAKAAIFKGDIIAGPKMIAYTFDAPTTPGTYFFRCDIHPTIMTGKFVVE